MTLRPVPPAFNEAGRLSAAYLECLPRRLTAEQFKREFGQVGRAMLAALPEVTEIEVVRDGSAVKVNVLLARKIERVFNTVQVDS